MSVPEVTESFTGSVSRVTLGATKDSGGTRSSTVTVGGASNVVYGGSIEDAGSMIGAPYRPMSNVSNSEDWTNDITKNTVHVLFHGPSLIVGYKDGNLVSIDDVQSMTCKWLYNWRGT